MKLNIISRKWVITNKDRTVIAKGVPRDRWLINLDNKKDKKRILTYNSKKKAESGIVHSGFYNASGYERKVVESSLEPVEVEINIREI